MSVPVIKAICRRIETRMGGGRNAALAAGVSGALWSQYCSGEHPTITIPIHRLLEIAEGDERRAIASLFTGEDEQVTRDLIGETMEASEAMLRVQGTVRLAAADGQITEAEKRRIRAEALEARAQLDDVIQGVG